MKLDEIVLLEIVDIVRDGLVSGTDISQRLRDLDLVATTATKLTLSDEYLTAAGRAPA